jgi:hypothetical protein
MTAGKLLMTGENPTGWKLEDLLPAIAAELKAKNEVMASRVAQITGETEGRVRAKVSRNNAMIANLLSQCTEIQRDTMAALDTLGKDPGPTGTPRV